MVQGFSWSNADKRESKQKKTYKIKKKKKKMTVLPTPGIEPGPRRWERRILTTRPYGIWRPLWEMQDSYIIAIDRSERVGGGRGGSEVVTFASCEEYRDLMQQTVTMGPVNNLCTKQSFKLEKWCQIIHDAGRCLEAL